jgi:tetratricopeptide (TPR) repeat protein
MMTTFNLGDYRREITTTSDIAKKHFDDGLIWIFGFNYEAAAACFEAAIEADWACGMAHWGVAFAIGPNYNKPWDVFGPEERVATLARAHAALSAARALHETLSPVENALIEALGARYPEDPRVEDFQPWTDAFAAAMRDVYKAHPDDPDVVCVFAEALITRTPWMLWDARTGQAHEGASTPEALAVLQRAFDVLPGAWDHPGLLHIYIHTVEMSPTPEIALRHGDRLVNLVPDSGHLVHMATHIDLVCGDYQNVVDRNHRAANIDDKYAAMAGAKNFYTVYRIHNVHFAAYGAMYLGQPGTALAATERLMQMLPDEVVRYMPDLFESFWGKKVHVLVRFGRWQEILDQPLPEDRALYTYTTAAMRQARAIALANLGRAEDAIAEQRLAKAACANVQETRMVFSNTAQRVLAIGDAMMDGEVAFKSGRTAKGLDLLRRAVVLEDGLLYDEPWGWMQPTRHALGALLMQEGLYVEADAVYRTDLGFDNALARPKQHPRNVWSLHGLHECLIRRGATAEAGYIKPLLDQALARASVPIHASCYCRSMTEQPSPSVCAGAAAR